MPTVKLFPVHDKITEVWYDMNTAVKVEECRNFWLQRSNHQ
jgi:hypothetical protein